jgi:hypothetical protein
VWLHGSRSVPAPQYGVPRWPSHRGRRARGLSRPSGDPYIRGARRGAHLLSQCKEAGTDSWERR